MDLEIGRILCCFYQWQAVVDRVIQLAIWKEDGNVSVDTSKHFLLRPYLL